MNLIVRECVSGVAQCGSDVIPCETRIRVEKIRLGRALAQFAKDQFNGNPRAADHRPPEHHARIDLDASGDGHTKRIFVRVNSIFSQMRRTAATRVPKRQDFDPLRIREHPLIDVVTNSSQVQAVHARQRNLPGTRAQLWVD